MRLTRLKHFREKFYDADSRPCMMTLRRDVKNGLIRGGFQDIKGNYWVDQDVFLSTYDIDAVIEGLKSDPLVAKAVEGMDEL